jgi:hypothetical protein
MAEKTLYNELSKYWNSTEIILKDNQNDLRTIENEIADFKTGFVSVLAPLEQLYEEQLYHFFTEESKDCCCCATITVELNFKNFREERFYNLSMKHYDYFDAREYGAQKAKELVLIILNKDIEKSLDYLYADEDNYPKYTTLQAKINDVQIIAGKVNFEIQQIFDLAVKI